MRRVTITYADGRVEEFPDMKTASAYLGCMPRTIRKAEMGRGGRIWPQFKARGIVAIKTDEPGKYSSIRLGSMRNQGHRQSVMVTCEATGETTRCRTLADAKKLTCDNVIVSYWLDDGKFHRGWKFDTCEPEPPVKFGDIPVPDDHIKQFYRIANHYVWNSWHINPNNEDVKDIIQEAVMRTAAEESRGCYDNVKWKEWGLWAYARIKSNSSGRLHKLINDRDRRAECPDENFDHQEWIEGLATVSDGEDEEEYLLNIPEQFRELARMILQGYSFIEISCIMGVSPSAVSIYKRKFKKWLMSRRGKETDSDSA